VINGSISDPVTQSHCCQEFLRDLYCMGPLLFLTYIDSLPAVVSNHYTSVNLLYHLITDTTDYAVLQETITLLEDWSITNHLNFNVSTCKCMIISRKNSPNFLPNQLYPLGDSLQRVECYKYLAYTHCRYISLQFVLRPNRSLVFFTGASMAQYGLATP